MVIKNQRGMFVNLAQMIYIELDKNNEQCRIHAWFNGPVGIFHYDGGGDLGPSDIVMFEGTKEECEDYMDWLYRELDAVEYTPDRG